MKRLQESRTVEISVYGLTRGVGLTTHSYSIGVYETTKRKGAKTQEGQRTYLERNLLLAVQRPERLPVRANLCVSAPWPRGVGPSLPDVESVAQPVPGTESLRLRKTETRNSKGQPCENESANQPPLGKPTWLARTGAFTRLPVAPPAAAGPAGQSPLRSAAAPVPGRSRPESPSRLRATR